MDAKALFGVGENLFSKRSFLVNLWQLIAENFYPERADFSGRRSIGADFASDLTTSYPLLVRRDLANSLSSMLRPTEKPWFHITTQYEDRLDNSGKQWLEQAAKTQRRAMYDRSAQFNRATKEGDHDFATFGQCVISLELNKDRDGLLYRAWHLRDVAWQENIDGAIGSVYRKWKPTTRELVTLFGGNVHQDVTTRVAKEPFAEVDCRHIVVESDMADGKSRTPYVSIFYDAEHNHVMEQIGVMDNPYIIPRWQTMSGSQYAFSPATVAALPDARLLQAMSYTLLEAGEKMTNPPLVAVKEAIRSDISLYAGGITWVDAEYDERLGEVLRPLTQDKSGMPIGIDMQRDARYMLAEAFYINKLTMPARAPEMTAYEVGQRIQQYVRDALPLFEPMEAEYNGSVCERTFSLLMRVGAFGSPMDMPKSLRGAEIQFRFRSPLHDAIEREEGNRLVEAGTLISGAAQLDPGARHILDAGIALRAALEGVGVPAKWLRDEDTVATMREAEANQQQKQIDLQNMAAGADAVQKLSAVHAAA